jgi:hypothetical protein
MNLMSSKEQFKTMIKYTLTLLTFILIVGCKTVPSGSQAATKSDETPLLPSGWHVHDIARPQPPTVVPGNTLGAPPSDAIILFDGKDLSNWTGVRQPDSEKKRYNPDGQPLWKVKNGYMECTPTGDISTKYAFGDCQLHLEWLPDPSGKGTGQHKGNSGVFLMGKYEIQILDNFNNPTYADGSAGAVYGQTPPLAMALRPSDEWQTYDIIFKAPRFDGEKLVSPAYITVFVNGVLVQNQTEILGPTVYRARADYAAHPSKLPITLQDHDNSNRFRNIWIRELGN